jgi:anti-anti-sigma factor
MKTVINTDENLATIAPGSRFDFNTHREFRAAYERAIESAVRVIHVDLGEVNYLDSSALGMLLLLKDKAEAAGKRVVLVRASGVVSQILEVANFGRLFEIQ